jgi:hypothetical protein
MLAGCCVQRHQGWGTMEAMGWCGHQGCGACFCLPSFCLTNCLSDATDPKTKQKPTTIQPLISINNRCMGMFKVPIFCACMVRGSGGNNVIFQVATILLLSVLIYSNRCQYAILKVSLNKIEYNLPVECVKHRIVLY